METKYVSVRDVYNLVIGTDVSLEVDGDDLVIRIPYLSGDAREIKEIAEAIKK